MAGTRNLRATGPSVLVALAADTNHQEGTWPAGGDAVLVQNEGPSRVRVAFGLGSVVATTTCLPMAGGLVLVIGIPVDADHYSVLADGGAATVTLTPVLAD